MQKDQCTTTYGVRRQGGPVSASLIKTLPSTRANHHSERSCVFTVFYHAIRCCDKNPLADRHKLNKILFPSHCALLLAPKVGLVKNGGYEKPTVERPPLKKLPSW